MLQENSTFLFLLPLCKDITSTKNFSWYLLWNFDDHHLFKMKLRFFS